LAITVDRVAGVNAVLGGIMLGGGGTPPTTSAASQGSWVGAYGGSGYDLAAWNRGTDVVAMPTASVTLAHGSRYVWASSTTDVRALQSASGSPRAAATYYDSSQIRLQLSFSPAYTGNLELYALDWDSNARREKITLATPTATQTATLSGDFSQGQWVSFPLSAATTVTITVDRIAGANAVLGGIFLSGGGPAPQAPSNTAAPTISGTDRQGSTLSTSNGTWSGTAPISYTYQWQRCDAGGVSCQNVTGATSSTYALGSADVDSTLRVSVTATNGAGSASATSATTNVVALASDPVVVAVGDIACPAGDTTHSCKQQATATLAKNQNPTTVFVLGDNQYNSGSLSEYDSTGAYNATWGVFGCALCSLNPPIVHPVPGNHEYGTSGAAGYFQYFGQAIANPANTPNGYYSLNLGTWHIDALNSNCTDSGCSDPLPGSTTTAQTSWLQSDLAANRSACTLAMWHHPLFSDGWTLGSPGVAPLWTALYNAHADLVLGGHDHLYERYKQRDPSGNPTANGIREFVVGTGGESLNGLGSSNANLEASDTSDFGVMVLTLHPTSYDYKFTTTSGTVKDSGTGVPCHGRGASGSASVQAAPDVGATRSPGLSGPPLVFDAHPLHSSLTAAVHGGVPVAIHASRGVDVVVTVSMRRGRHLQRIASFYETESEIPKPYSQILLRLPAHQLKGLSHATLLLRFAAVDSAFHRRDLTRIVLLK
jgi:hypothetical protein